MPSPLRSICRRQPVLALLAGLMLAAPAHAQSRFPVDFLSRELSAKTAILELYAKPVTDVQLRTACVSGIAAWRIADSGEQARFAQGLANLKSVGQGDIDAFMQTLDPAKVSPQEREALGDLCIRAMLATLDGRSLLYSRQDQDMLQARFEGRAGSLRFQSADFNDARVTSVPLDSLAYRDGLRVGDRIDSIDGQALASMVGRNPRNYLVGPLGSKVALTVSRPGVAAPVALQIERETLTRQPARVEPLADGIVYVLVPTMDPASLSELGRGLARQAQARGVVLDLRGSPGGHLSAVVGVASAFMSPGSLVTEDRPAAGKKPLRLSARPEFYALSANSDGLKDVPAWTKTVPIAVLVDGGTSVGAEVIAAALQDSRGARIVGRQTARLGYVQTAADAGGGARMTVTSGYLYRPTLQPIEGVGVQPDVELAPGTDDATEIAAAVQALGGGKQ